VCFEKQQQKINKEFGLISNIWWKS